MQQQQRQLRLGDILDDYCPRERRLTNHAVVAMVGNDVKQTRCTTCDAEHEFKHAKVPRQRRKVDTPPALYAQVLAGAPKRVAHDEHGGENGGPSNVEDLLVRAAQAAPPQDEDEPDADAAVLAVAPPEDAEDLTAPADGGNDDAGDEREDNAREEGPVHRPLIRASLPRLEGQAPPARPAPDFTIRQPGGGRPGRFRPHHQRGGQQFQGPRSNGSMGGPMRGGPPRAGGGRPPHGPITSRPGRRDGPGRKRSK
jgi:hypothetical protein